MRECEKTFLEAGGFRGKSSCAKGELSPRVIDKEEPLASGILRSSFAVLFICQKKMQTLLHEDTTHFAIEKVETLSSN